MSLKVAKQFADRVEGWLDPEEGELLYAFARNCNRGTIVEIGTWQGKSTVYLGMGSRDGNRMPVISIDPHCFAYNAQGDLVENGFSPNMNIARDNMRNSLLSDSVKIMRGYSQDAADLCMFPVGMLFVDGDHTPSAIIRDILDWTPHLVDGSIIAFHDSWHPNVYNILEEYIFGNPHFWRVGSKKGVVYATYSKKPVPWFYRMTSFYMIGLGLLYAKLRHISPSLKPSWGGRVYSFLREVKCMI